MVGIAFLAAQILAVAVACFWIGLAIRRQERSAARRIEQAAAAAGPLLSHSMELQAPFIQRVIQPLIRGLLQRVGSLSPQRNLGKLRRQLLIAGSPHGLGPLDFVGLRILVALFGTVFLCVALMTMSISLGRALLAAVAGALLFAELPSLWLHRKMKGRKKEITLALADALDMLTVCVDAGLGLESAFMRIGQAWDHALAQEFRRTVRETGLGVSWRDAMRNMVYRTDVPELSALVAVLLQADQLGFSISDTLHAQADQLRVKRRQRAQELARAAPLKMLFPMVFFILPATFAVVLGPAVPALLEAFRAM
ncbi:MAG: type II secretion system F family protein [Anaerolineae bacterium]|nr:type II secretion system F family protein [Anaerolineae bacterium]